jgi:hypothetical protein
MKQVLTLTALMLVLSLNIHAQTNLVPNPGFEDTSACPNGLDQLFKSPPWNKPTTGTPDYFNDCDNNTGYSVGVPANAFGVQVARTGNGYSGAFIYSDNGTNYREYLQVQLNDTLEAGKEYCVSFYVSLADSSMYACNDIGVYFSNASTSISNNSMLPFIPQVANSSTNQLLNKTIWTLVSDSFIASGNELYLIIGNFIHDTLTDISSSTGASWVNGAYYYIDDVSVVLCDTTTGFNEQEESESIIYPNPSSGIYNITSKEKILNISVYSNFGQQLHCIPVNDNAFQLDLSHLPNGIYWLNGEKVDGVRIWTRKIILTQ